MKRSEAKRVSCVAKIPAMSRYDLHGIPTSVILSMYEMYVLVSLMVLTPIVFVSFHEKAKYCNTVKNFQTRILFAFATVKDVIANLSKEGYKACLM